MEKSDWIGLIAILLLVVGGSMVTYYIITENINKCTSDPLKFTVDKVVEGKNYSYVELKIYLYKGDLIPIKTSTIDLNKGSLFLVE